MDEGILQEFLAESAELLGQVERDLIALEREPSDPSRLSSVFRAIHSIKGTCGFFGFSRLQNLTHAGEDLLSRLRAGELRLTLTTINVLLELVDSIRSILTRIEETRQEGDEDFARLIGALNQLSASGAVPSPEISTPDRADSSPGPPGGGLLGPLLATGRLDPEAVASAVQQQRLGDPRRIGEILVDQGALEPKDVLEALIARGERSAQVLAEGSVRVDVHLLDVLMNLVGELVLARNQLLQFSGAEDISSLPATTQRLNMITSELQEGIMRTRMQPIANLCNKLPRIVRDVAGACGKQVHLEMEGIDTELDRTILEAIRDPLTHLIRNAIDHGIETSTIRTERGKPAHGTLRVRAWHEGGKVILEVMDDGGGMPLERIREKAMLEHLVPRERAGRMTDRDWAQLVFQPGFSTAEQVTSVSGRGVGMDVVKTNVERIGGTVDIDTKSEVGTTVRIRIPLTLAIIPALIVGAGSERYAIPQVNILELIRVDGSELGAKVARAFDAPVFRYRGSLIPLVDLCEQIGVLSTEPPAEEANGRPAALSLVVLHADGATFGLVVGEIRASQEIVVKPLGEPFRQIPVFAGATILGDGTVALIIDAPGLARHAGIPVLANPGPGRLPESGSPQPAVAPRAMLLCRVGGSRSVAISQAQITRLEEFRRNEVERAGGRNVVQYRGGILPLVHVAELLGGESTAGPDLSGPLRVIVHEYDGRNVGLVVDEIRGIVEELVTLQMESGCTGIVGSAIIGGCVTDLLDLGRLLAARSPDGALVEAPGASA